MSTHWLSATLLFLSWIGTLLTLLVFLESWFAASGRDRFIARRASGAYGPVSIFLLMRGPAEQIEKTIRSVLSQSYPFIELFLIHFEDDGRHANLAREFRMGSHVRVRLAPVAHAVQSADDRVRALEQVQPVAKGRWYAVLDSGVILDRLAVESSLEFAGNGEISALVLRPGVRCSTFLGRLLAPSVEYAMGLVRLADRRREGARKIDLDPSFLLVNRAAFDAVNRVNRLPGILNDAGWTLWGYQVEHLRTFDADAAQSIWREAALGSLPAYSQRRRYLRRSLVATVFAGAMVSLVSVAGIAYGLLERIGHTLINPTILAFSAATYLLMTASYFLHARRCRAAAWFAPLWFLTHLPASILLAFNMRTAAGQAKQTTTVHKATKL